MPFSQTQTIRFGDGADEATSTQVGDLEITSAGVALIHPVAGLGTDMLTFPDPAVLASRLDQLDGFVTADQGAKLDIADDTATQNDMSFCEYNVSAPDASPPANENVVLQSSSSKVHTYQVDTYQGLRLALSAAGY